MPVQQSSTGTPGWGGTVRVVNRRQSRSMFRLSRWFSRSYRPAIEANIRLHPLVRLVDLPRSLRYVRASVGEV